MKKTKLVMISLLVCGFLAGCNKSSETPQEIHEHVWSAPQYFWSSDHMTCRAERVCTEDATHTESEMVDSVYTVVTESTCESDGLGKYTATFVNSAFAVQTYEEVIKGGHDFRFDSFVWTDFTAQAKYLCAKDSSHVELHDAIVSSEVTTDPTCDTEGVRTYTAFYDGHTDTKTETVDAIGHEYNPITGHCNHEGCEGTIAVNQTVNYGDGTLKTENFVSGDYVRDEKHIFDIVFDGTAASTNLVIGLTQGESTGIFRTNCTIVVYDEDYNVLELNAFSSNAIYSLAHQFANGDHICVHVTLKYSDFTNVTVHLTSHQYTGLKAVATTAKTCVSPSILAHVEFDQSSSTNTWLDINATIEKPQDDFKKGDAGTGHNLSHRVATEATSTSPALKEHWYCSNCGCYYLSEDAGEEVAYEDLYDNTIYGLIQKTVNITGRGTLITVRLTVDNGGEPIENEDGRYVGQTGKCVFEDGSISDGNMVTSISVNVHIVQFMLKGVTYADFIAKNPTAFFINL